MTTRSYDGPVRVGELRPSQLLHSFGIGALIDLPNLSVIVGGLDRWDITKQVEITEDRLLRAVRTVLGDQVDALRGLPMAERTTNSPFDDWARVGVPVTLFPRWLRCTRCSRLFPVASGALDPDLDHPYRTDRMRYVHANCDKAKRPVPAVPARFVAGCPQGHLDEFPWIQYCHDGAPLCANPMLQVNDIGTGGRATDLLVKCLNCGARGTLAKAFGPAALTTMPQCRGRHPHLGTVSNDCTEQLRTLVLGASNMWFSVTQSVLSLPIGGGSLDQLVYDNWAELSKMTVTDVVAYAIGASASLQSIFAGYSIDEIWAAIEARRATPSSPTPATIDVRGPEWTALVTGSAGSMSPHFEAEAIDPPAGFSLTGVTLAHRLREVTALCGFTRITAPEPGEVTATAPLASSHAPTWVPAVENRGEGIFLRLDEAAVQSWEASVEGGEAIGALWDAHRRWRAARKLVATEGWPGARFVLLHSLAHALINEMAIRCGYSSASIRERIYSRPPGAGLDPMAGILLYTSASDAEGTLGGLVSLGRPGELGPIIAATLERARLCSSDPLCSEHLATTSEDALHNAACHACLFVSETSCERGNRYLDRATLVDTFTGAGAVFFT